MSDRKINQEEKSVYIEKGENITINYNGVEIPQALTYTPFRHEHFIGRTKELSDIYAALRSDDRPLLVNGQGGVGKTTLATHYFREYAHEYAHTAWVTCEGNIADDLISRLQDTLGIRDQLRNIIDRPQRTQILLRVLASLQKTCLLVLDNANDPADLQAHYQVLRSCPNFHILLTTRINEFRQAHFYPIKGLPIADALRLFRQYYPALTDTETQTVRQIHQAVGANTLVIELLAKNLHQLNRLRTHYTLDDLLHDLREKGLLHLQSKTVHTDYGTLQHAKPEDIILAMYDMSDLTSEECQLLSIFSVLPSENISFETLEDLLTLTIDDVAYYKQAKDALESMRKRVLSDEFRDILEIIDEVDTLTGTFPIIESLEEFILQLYESGWLDYNKVDNSFKISTLVQNVVLKKQQDRLYTDCEVLIWYLVHKLEYEGYPGNLINATYEIARLYIKYSESLIGKFNLPKHNLIFLYGKIGSYHMSVGNLDRAFYFFKKRMEIYQRIYEAEPKNTDYKNGLALAYQNLGTVYDALGNLEAALDCFEINSELMSQLNEKYPEDVYFKDDLAASYHFLGKVHFSLGDSKQAFQFYEQHSKLIEQLHDNDSQDVSLKKSLAISYQNLGQKHYSLGNFEKTLFFFKNYVKLTEDLHENYPETIDYKHGLSISYQHLGLAYASMNKFKMAFKFLSLSNELSEQLYRDYPHRIDYKDSLAITYSHLGVLYKEKLNAKEKAKVYFQQCYDIWNELVRDFPAYAEFQKNYKWAKNALGLSDD